MVATLDDALCLFGRLDLLGEGREGEHMGLGIDLLILVLHSTSILYLLETGVMDASRV